MKMMSVLALSTALVTLPLWAAAEDLRIAFADPVSSLDPQLNNHAGDHSVAQHFWTALVQQRTEGGLIPGLASEWTNTSPTTWEFTLRPDAVWTDGQPITADDVAFSYARALDVPGSVASYKSFLRTVDKVEVKDDHHLVITTKAPDPILPINLSSVYVTSRHATEGATSDDFNSGKAMVTSGPYAFVSYTPGDRIEMKRNDSFWGEKAEWDNVSYRFINNGAARTAALLAGDVDVIDKVSVADLPHLEADQKLKVWSYPGLRVLILQPSFSDAPSSFITAKDGKPLDKNPLLDVKVRQALSMAINREAIVDRVMRGGATVASQWMPEGISGYDPERATIATDPEKAKALLAEAGYPDGFKLTMHVPGDRYPLAPETAQAVAQFWTRIGVETSVEVVPWAVYSKSANGGEYAMTMVAWGNGTAEGTYAMTSILATQDKDKGLGASNWGRYSNPKLDQALAAASSEFDPEKREAIVHDAVKVVMDDAGIIPLLHYKNIWASRADLKVVPWNSDRTVAMQVHKGE